MRGVRTAAVVAAVAGALVVGRRSATLPELPACSTRDGERLVDLGRRAPDECLAVVLDWRRLHSAKDAGP